VDIVVEVHGVTCLNNIMYVVCDESSTILLYNTDTYSPLDVVINVDKMRLPRDIVVCRDGQLYVADWNRVWRVADDWVNNGHIRRHQAVVDVTSTTRDVITMDSAS